MGRRRFPRWYVGLLFAVAVQKLVELAISRKHEAGRRDPRAAERSYPLMVAAHAGLVTLPLLEVAGHPSRRPRARWAAVLAAATVLRVWSIRSLGGQWNVRASVPADLVPVVTGPYAYIRHPNYLAVILEFAAIPLVGGARRSAAALSALNAGVLFHRIRAEEALLNTSPTYRRAFANRARFIPGLF